MSETVRRTYKDTLFRDLFGSEERKANTLSLYNALSDTSLTDEDQITLTTIDDAVYMTHKNDCSFIIDPDMMLWEQQSTRCGNMAIRALSYLDQLMNKFIVQNDLKVYGSASIMFPSATAYVFHTGKANVEEERELLSSHFTNGIGPEFEVRIINIREGLNQGLKDKCEAGC